MQNIKSLVENKKKLDYPALCEALMDKFGVNETPNWESVLPLSQQQELFGGEILRLIENHPDLAGQKEIRPLALKRGTISQMVFFYVALSDNMLPKKQIEQITKRFIKGAEANRYIIWFFGNKEATELKVVLSGREGKKTVLKTLPFGINQPYYKTYDFILTEVASKVNQIFIEPIDLWKALWNAFDISIVNRNFYNEIKQAFDLLLEELNCKGNPFKNDDDRIQFGIRLIGRIIFCWFLKRKGIITQESVSSFAVLNYKNGNYYHQLLEPLFFEVMNKPEKERIHSLPKVISKYPFLNGGLFDATHETDFYNTDKSIPNFRLQIQNEWFHSFFSVTLEKYNFTVDENSTTNAEIAIDPEMLGRIFENLLAEVNPETGEIARNATGSFYTPREIVDYMVEQSISEYLKTAFSVVDAEPTPEMNLFGVIPNQQLKIIDKLPKPVSDKLNSAIEEFVHTVHFSDELIPYEEDLLEALNKIRVLDPACGSGAFPISILQKLIALKQEILQHQNPKKQTTKASTYKLKLETIQNSIFGVDIQPMAVELSRLRCWLSLVVDEENDSIKALPNLDFKFVCANSLVNVPEDAYILNQSQKSLKELEGVIEKYFNPEYKQKKELQETIKRCLNEITNTHQRAIAQIIEQSRKEKNSATSGRLKQLEQSLISFNHQQSLWLSYKNLFENKRVDFFDTKYFFPSLKAGFDIVIGNPPYLRIQGIRDADSSFADELIKNYKSATGSFDLYVLFLEKGLSLINPKGIVNYIMPIKWTNAAFGSGLREIISQTNSAYKIISFGSYQVFNASTYTGLQWFKRKSDYLLYFELDRNLASTSDLSDYLNSLSPLMGTQIPNDKLKKDSWVLTVGKTSDILNKLNQQPRRLSDIFEKIFQGLATSKDDVYFLYDCVNNGKYITGFSKHLKTAVKIENDFTKPLLKGTDIHRYEDIKTDKAVIFPYKLIDDTASLYTEDEIRSSFPNAYKYLKQCEDTLRDREKGRFNIDGEWFQYGRKQGIISAEKEKLLAPEISLGGNFSYDENGGFYSTTTIYGYIKKSGVEESYKCLLAILNSHLFWWYLVNTGTVLANGYFRYKPNYIKPFPFPAFIPKNIADILEKNVDDILTIKNNYPRKNCPELEANINKAVYKLYQLTSGEIKCIEDIK